jgi:hypothetical protein
MIAFGVLSLYQLFLLSMSFMKKMKMEVNGKNTRNSIEYLFSKRKISRLEC